VQKISSVIRYVWATPTTAIGLVVVAAGFWRARVRVVDGVLEAHGPVLAWMLAHLTLLPDGAAALTLGHVVIARDRRSLELTRVHERVHVRQCEAWGPLFLPAYLAASLTAALRGRDFYLDNRFEIAAFRAAAISFHPMERRTSSIPIRVAAIVLSLACGSVMASWAMHASSKEQQRGSAKQRDVPGQAYSSRRMADGKQWTTNNLNVSTEASYCYADAELNCPRYGRLYAWASAQRGCQSLGDGWRLPTDDEWRQLAKQFGGVHDDAEDGGKAAYAALMIGGRSGFNAVLGGGRSEDGQYARIDAHGFYWTASEIDRATAVFYNFGHGGLMLYRQSGRSAGEKLRAFSVRCVRE
jgi:uncharacterized protein (TIGR02145 family)